MERPAARPKMVAQKTPILEYVTPLNVQLSGSIQLIIKNEATSIRAADRNSPRFKAFCGSPPSFTRTKKVPKIDVKIPTPARTKGRITADNPLKLSAHGPPSIVAPAIKAAPRTIVPMIDPTYDSKRSAPIPATSPTLSPTLAGFNG